MPRFQATYILLSLAGNSMSSTTTTATSASSTTAAANITFVDTEASTTIVSTTLTPRKN